MLRLNDVYAAYDDVTVLFGVTLEVNQGEIVAIVGSNGAGKSTILRTISGLLRPRQGSITFEGQQLDQLPVHQVTALGIAHIPEGRRVFARRTVYENLILGAHTRPDAQQRKNALERIYGLFPRLYERREQPAGTLSGGEQQMLAFGRGLMLNPKLLMLDEPSLGIAPKLVDEIFQAVRQVNRDGTPVLLVEQNVTDALEMADRAYVLQTGQVVTSGAGKELLHSDLVRSAYLGM